MIKAMIIMMMGVLHNDDDDNAGNLVELPYIYDCENCEKPPIYDCDDCDIYVIYMIVIPHPLMSRLPPQLFTHRHVSI